MSKQKIPERKPAVLELEAGQYYWCQCGESRNQPYCDGYHKNTDFTPVEFLITEKKRVAPCQCKQANK